MARTRASRGRPRGRGRGRGGQSSSPRDSSAPYSRHTTPSTCGSAVQTRRGGTNMRLPFILSSSTASASCRSENGQKIRSDLPESNRFATTTSGSRYFSTTTGPSAPTQPVQAASTTRGQPTFTSQGQTTSATQGFSREVNAGSYEEQGAGSSVVEPLNPDSIDDTDNEVVMAVDVRDRYTLGCAYYIAREEKLYFMQDCKLSDKTMVETCQCPKIDLLIHD
jgi:hypothetical protein